MKEEYVVTGIILYTALVGEYDKRLVVLTKERGKITIFSNGSRRPNSMLRAASQSYVMGKFTITANRDSYNLVKAEVDEYFSELAYDMEKMCYASYFCEFMSYYTREGMYCTNHLNLLYVTLKAVVLGNISYSLIKDIYEIRLMDIEGQGIHAYKCVGCNSEDVRYFSAAKGGLLCASCAMKYKISDKVSDTLIYTLKYILSSPYGKLYSFKLTEEAERELDYVCDRFRRQYVDKNFKSLEILSSLA